MCFIAFILKTTGCCKFLLYLQDPVITEPYNFVALGTGCHWPFQGHAGGGNLGQRMKVAELQSYTLD